MSETVAAAAEKNSKIPLKLAKKLLNVMKALGDVPKTGTNEKDGYDYVEEKNLVPRFRKAIIENNIWISHSVLCSSREGDLTKIRVRYTFVDCEHEEQFSVEQEGSGADSEDKGLYKALTGAHKYFILRNFNLTSTEDPEKNKPETENQKNEQKPSNGPTQNQPQPGRSFSLSKKQINRMFAIANEANWAKDDLAAYCKAAFNVGVASKLTKTQYDLICGIMPKLSFQVAMEKLTGQGRPRGQNG